MKKLIVLFLLIGSITTYSQTNTQPAPTIENCGCVVKEAFKITSNSTKAKEGKVVIYSNLISFTFGSTYYSFELIPDMPGFVYDVQKATYIKVESQKDLKYIRYNKSIIAYRS